MAFSCLLTDWTFMRLLPAFILSGLFSLVSISVLAAPNCQNAMTQMDMNECAAIDFKNADLQLNKLYKELFSKLETGNQQALKLVQQNWIKYKESQCKYEADEFKGGSIAPLILYSCQSRITKQRNADLIDMLKSTQL